MLQTGKMNFQRNSRQGVTLVEILIVSTIIAIMAALSFPVYKIIQQREKERKLQRFLDNVRVAIHGYQANNNNRNRIKNFQEGYKGYILQRGISQIEDVISNKAAQNAAIKEFLDRAIKDGWAYPETIWHLTPLRLPHTVYIATDPTAIGDYSAEAPADQYKYVSIVIDHPFIRNIPPHPFKDWYPQATWNFKFLNVPGGPVVTAADGLGHTHVTQIISVGAGPALDGVRSTNDF